MYRPCVFNQLSQLLHERTCAMGLRRDLLQCISQHDRFTIVAFYVYKTRISITGDGRERIE